MIAAVDPSRSQWPVHLADGSAMMHRSERPRQAEVATGALAEEQTARQVDEVLGSPRTNCAAQQPPASSLSN
jgi:hypothetical protein